MLANAYLSDPLVLRN